MAPRLRGEEGRASAEAVTRAKAAGAAPGPPGRAGPPPLPAISEGAKPARRRGPPVRPRGVAGSGSAPDPDGAEVEALRASRSTGRGSVGRCEIAGV